MSEVAVGGQAEQGWRQKQEVEHRAKLGWAGGCGVDRGVDGVGPRCGQAGASLWLGPSR